eukprot:GHRR01012272.1.p1 GENE.GHRR01012272.1~~GHRR01012272.1.p1  ORF type:complete len:136 (+),score=6.12 GHRR01012272.1:225-632(+)
MTTAIQDLEIACLVRIFSHLSPKECARVACVHPLWNLALSDDVIWKSRLAANFAAYTAVNPDNIPAESYRSVAVVKIVFFQISPEITRAAQRLCCGPNRPRTGQHSPQKVWTMKRVVKPQHYHSTYALLLPICAT